MPGEQNKKWKNYSLTSFSLSGKMIITSLCFRNLMNVCNKDSYERLCFRGKVTFSYHISHLVLPELIAREYQEKIKLAPIPR